MRDEDRSPWWCEHCQADVPPEHVTWEENHDSRAGGCGQSVLPEKPTATAPDHAATTEHECSFPEEREPSGRRILGPCLLCDFAAADAMNQMRARSAATIARLEAERDGLRESLAMLNRCNVATRALLVRCGAVEMEVQGLQEPQVTGTDRMAQSVLSAIIHDRGVHARRERLYAKLHDDWMSVIADRDRDRDRMRARADAAEKELALMVDRLNQQIQISENLSSECASAEFQLDDAQDKLAAAEARGGAYREALLRLAEHTPLSPDACADIARAALRSAGGRGDQ